MNQEQTPYPGPLPFGRGEGELPAAFLQSQVGSPERKVRRLYQPAPELQALLEQIKIIGNDLDSLTRENVGAVRAVREKRAEHFLWKLPVETVREFVVPGDQASVAVRLYVPQDKQLIRDGKLPVIIFFHGVAWTLARY